MHCKQLNHIGIFTSWTFNLSIGEYHFSQKGPYYMDIIIGSLLEKFFTLWVPINISGSLFHKKLGPYWIPIVKLGCSYQFWDYWITQFCRETCFGSDIYYFTQISVQEIGW